MTAAKQVAKSGWSRGCPAFQPPRITTIMSRSHYSRNSRRQNHLINRITAVMYYLETFVKYSGILKVSIKKKLTQIIAGV